MPFVSVLTNMQIVVSDKPRLAEALTTVYAEVLKTERQHCHVIINDGQYFSYAGNDASPACLLSIKSSEQQIAQSRRKDVVVSSLPILKEFIPGLVTERVTTIFEEYPVENIAVGDYVLVFSPTRPPLTGADSGPFFRDGPEP